jgi:hypothetical protein
MRQFEEDRVEGIPSGEDDDLTLRELLREMREELRQFRQEFRKFNGGERD